MEVATLSVLELPRRLLYGYLRLLGLGLLIVYSLWQRFWDSVQPTIRPLREVYENVNHKSVTLACVVEQCVKVVVMISLLYYKLLVTVWETVLRPFQPQLEQLRKFLADVERDYRQVTPSTAPKED